MKKLGIVVILILLVAWVASVELRIYGMARLLSASLELAEAQGRFNASQGKLNELQGDLNEVNGKLHEAVGKRLLLERQRYLLMTTEQREVK